MTAGIHPTAIIESGAVIADDVTIGAYAYVGPRVQLGPRVALHHGAVVTGETRLGADVEVHSSSVIGGSAQIVGLAREDEGITIVGDRTVFREHTSVHAGSVKSGGRTVIGEDCYFMAGSHAGHDCRFGARCVLANGAIFGGHCHLGDDVWSGGQVAVHQFTEIGDHAFLGGGSVVGRDVIPFGAVTGNRARLSGLNLVGLKRRGFSREAIGALRGAYKTVFESEGQFADRVAAAEAAFGLEPHAARMLAFIKADRKRPLCSAEA